MKRQQSVREGSRGIEQRLVLSREMSGQHRQRAVFGCGHAQRRQRQKAIQRHVPTGRRQDRVQRAVQDRRPPDGQLAGTASRQRPAARSARSARTQHVDDVSRGCGDSGVAAVLALHPRHLRVWSRGTRAGVERVTGTLSSAAPNEDWAVNQRASKPSKPSSPQAASARRTLQAQMLRFPPVPTNSQSHNHAS